MACAGGAGPQGGAPAPIGGAGGAAAPAFEVGAPGPGPGRPTAGDCYVGITESVTVGENSMTVNVIATTKEVDNPKYPPAGRVLLVMDHVQNRSLETKILPDGGNGKASFVVDYPAGLLEDKDLTPEAYRLKLHYYVSLEADGTPNNADQWVPWASPNDYLPDGMAWLYGTCRITPQ